VKRFVAMAVRRNPQPRNRRRVRQDLRSLLLQRHLQNQVLGARFDRLRGIFPNLRIRNGRIERIRRGCVSWTTAIEVIVALVRQNWQLLRECMQFLTRRGRSFDILKS
jgi:hypothetical protein